VWWSDRTHRSDIHLIVIGGQSTWTAPDGLRLGQTLEQVEKINHKPFKLKGFDKDRIKAINGSGDFGLFCGIFRTPRSAPSC
jgi:hypothetical protein